MRRIRSRTYAWMKVDYRVGFVLCIVAGCAFAGAIGGWIILFSGVSDMNARLEVLRSERNMQLSEIRETMQKLDGRLVALAEKLAHVDTVARANATVVAAPAMPRDEPLPRSVLDAHGVR